MLEDFFYLRGVAEQMSGRTTPPEHVPTHDGTRLTLSEVVGRKEHPRDVVPNGVEEV